MGLFGDVCPRHVDPVKRWKSLVKQHFRGQGVALKMVEKAFKVSLYLKESPTMLHFSGPTGVGKSFLATLLARAVFRRENPICGFLQLRMSIMMRQIERERQDEMMERYLLRPIVEQLAVCPSSIIVIDDIHFLENEYLRRLRTIFDESNPIVMCTTGPYKGKQWSTRGSFFIVTSDLDENTGSLNSSMPNDEAIDVIRNLAMQQWGESSHMASLSTLIPFLPLTQDQLISIAQDQLEHLHELIDDMLEKKKKPRSLLAKGGGREHHQQMLISSLTIDWIGSLKYSASLALSIYKQVETSTKRYGARPINNFMRLNVYPLAIDIARQLLDKGAKSKVERVKSESRSKVWEAIEKYIPAFEYKIKIINDIEIWLDEASGEMLFKMEGIDVNEFGYDSKHDEL
eukprot:jgi/Bigna1/71770/fgenesh1_pg.17_\